MRGIKARILRKILPSGKTHKGFDYKHMKQELTSGRLELRSFIVTRLKFKKVSLRDLVIFYKIGTERAECKTGRKLWQATLEVQKRLEGIPI